MAVSSSSNLLLLLLIFSLDWLSSPGCAFLMDRHNMGSSAPVEPHFTECISRDQETFRCWWSTGEFHNLTSPGALKVFYLRKDSPTSVWKECPDYIHSNRECFFDRNHTSVWIPYCVQIRGPNNVTYFSEDDCFTVENIVRPDPPVSLNWTLLNISPSGLNYDIMVNWEPPPSADVSAGWMRLAYEIQYRERNATNWEAMDMQPHMQQSIYGLHIGKDYEVHIRCRMLGFTKFGEFSESIFIQVTEIPLESTFPLTLVFVFGVLGIFILITLIVVSQQHRLMMILLPPVPAPKIKGIDPEMLKKGKLDELNFILSGGGMGGPPAYAPDFYQDEPWVEFIEVDAEDPDSGEKDSNQASDTQRLLGLAQPVSRDVNTGCSNAISFPDDDSGRASCYDRDLPDEDAALLLLPPTDILLPGQAEAPEGSQDVDAEREERPIVRTQADGGPETWVDTDFYAQVSNVMPSGGVVLSPGQQQLRIQESVTDEEAKKKKDKQKGKELQPGAEEKTPTEPRFQLLVVDPQVSGYTTESSARRISTPPSSPIPGEYQTILHPQPVDTNPAEDNQSPYVVPDPSPPMAPFFAPVADYTVVQEMEGRPSLLLNPPPPPPTDLQSSQSPTTPALCLPQHALKALPAMPVVGYVTPDLLGKFSP